MKNIPKKCDQCGAPIIWDEVSSSIKCDFCGSKTYIISKFVIIERIKDSAYKTFSPVGKTLGKAGKTLLKKQNVFSDSQVDKIGIKANKLFRNNYFKFFLIALPITLVANSIINDPVRKEFVSRNYEDYCNNLSSDRNSDFLAKKRYKSCIKERKENIKEDIQIMKEAAIRERKQEKFRKQTSQNWTRLLKDIDLTDLPAQFSDSVIDKKEEERKENCWKRYGLDSNNINWKRYNQCERGKSSFKKVFWIAGISAACVSALLLIKKLKS